MAEFTAGKGPSLSCTTFNVLAPIYKRLDQGLRESDFGAFWLGRNQKILDCLLHESSSIICLQEFWVGNEELVQLYLERFGHAGYSCFKLARTNNRGDGLLTAVRKDSLRVLNVQDLLFNDFGDRVAQLLHVQLVKPFSQNLKGIGQSEIIIVNTHLLFPHDSSLSIARLLQVYKILQYLETFQMENQLKPMPVILCGDWNGSKRGHVYQFLRSQGFVSSYDTAHHYTDNEVDAHKWVSHRNHRGNICGVDFIWLRNPDVSRKPLTSSWAEAVFSIIKYQLRKASLSEKDAFAFLKGDTNDDLIRYSTFCEALRQVNLIGLPHGLSYQDMRNLWTQADIDGNGVVDYEAFQRRLWNYKCLAETENENENENERKEGSNGNCIKEVVGLKVKDAVLFPREVEKGIWPDDYVLSDHARLTVLFSTVLLRCSL